MTLRHVFVGISSALLLAGTVTVLMPESGSAQQPAPAAADQQHKREWPLPSRHIEGRIAFMRAELKITGAQERQWDLVASAMRANAQRMDQMAQQMRANRGQAATAIDRLDQRARFTEVRLANDKSFADAFRPLYQSLSDDQKKSADEMFNRHQHGRRR
ncbi:MAG: Spy/CpxP family protein refolding chaperone [Pseudomonadota bacterium]